MAMQVGTVLGAGLGWGQAARALGLESVELPGIELPGAVADALEQRQLRQEQRLAEVEQRFQDSDLLATLKQRSEENAAKNKKDREDKYCYRQAELGIGDCGGLRFIPGATKNGVQKRPEWLNNLLGLDSQE